MDTLMTKDDIDVADEVRLLAVQALKAGKQRVNGTTDVMGYLVGKCDCPGNQGGKMGWFAHDATQVVGVAQGFVAHQTQHRKSRHSWKRTTKPTWDVAYHKSGPWWVCQCGAWRYQLQHTYFFYTAKGDLYGSRQPPRCTRKKAA